MTKTYKNPPLKEAVCEFRFELENPLTESQILTFYEKVKDDFPMQKKRRMHQVEVQFNTNGNIPAMEKPLTQNFHEFNVFLSEDGKNMIQMDGGRVSIHRLHQYVSWAAFLPIIQKVYKSYFECFAPSCIVRIGLRYINEILLPVENFDYKKYFHISLALPNLIEKTQKSIFIASVFDQEEGRDVIKVQFGDKPIIQGEKIQNRAFLLDFDYALMIPKIIDFDKIDDWVNVAHTNLEKTFEEMLTDETKSIFDN